ncbi:integrator complex subunit 1 isoform X2 [Arctopsyche grandis]|uniref:integrator complex subunit 1 isoform X2 n=1 Tax=Arctopsyche grandis TaxID=121162 RepID=UPI00406D9546
MERKSSQLGRGAKGKITQYPTDLYALGSKSSAVLNREDVKRTMHGKPTPPSSERKRDSPSTSVVPPTKKPKLASFGGSPGESSIPLDIDPVELIPLVLAAHDTHNTEKLVMQALCGVLKREQGTAFKSKGNPLVFVLACNLFYTGYKEEKNWPNFFIKVYIEDALNERWWVDCSWCKCFVDNIATAFLTTAPPGHLMPNDNNTLGTLSPSGSPLLGANEEDSESTGLEYSTYPRYSGSYETVETMVLDAIKEQCARRTATDSIGKGFLKLLAATSGSAEIRIIAACRLELWLHSGKLWRPAQELLAYLATNISGTSQRDQEVLAQLVKMRLKTKPLVNAYLSCLREMVSVCPATLHSVVTHTIFNELSSVRNPNSMAALASLIQAQPQAVPQAMAETFQELLMRTEEYLRPLRALIREAVRAGRAEGTQSLLSLCRALVTSPNKDPPAESRERMFHAIADLLSLCVMLTATHAKHHPDYRMQISSIQCDGVWWLHESALSLYRPQPQEYDLALRKIIFLEPIDTYCKLDNWPQESERTLAYRTSCEVPLLQNTLIGILCIGLAKELPVSPGEAVELCEQLVRRASALSVDDTPLPIDKIEVADYIFQLCQYHHPENIALPQGYIAPSLAISSLYWKAWMILVMIAAHNPHTFSRQAFTKFPTLKALIEMCITNKWTCVECVIEPEGEKSQILQFEGHLAAASTKVPITEHTSSLLSLVMLMNPEGVARRPPPSILEGLQVLNKNLRLGHLLCRQPALLLDIIARQGTQRAMPWLQDLLHNSEHSLSVLPIQCLCEFLVVGGSSGLGGKTHEVIRHLRQLVDDETTIHSVMTFFTQRLTHTHPPIRHQANRGLKLVFSPLTSEEPTEAEWNANVTPEEWLSIIPSSRHWVLIRDEVVTALRSGCLVETEPTYVTCYINFLADHAQLNCPTTLQLQDIVLDLGQLIVERMSIMAAIIPPTILSNDSKDVQDELDDMNPHQTLYALTSIFHQYMLRVREPRRESYDWCANQDQILLQWPSGEEGTMHIIIVHAIIILLTYGPSKCDKNEEIFEWFLSVWFGPNAPKAFVVETSEDACLFPDWLKLKMVRSNQPALIHAGLKDLDAQQLVLFIQSFGIPVNSMSTLLSALDACPTETLSGLVVERGYMAQLVGVQWRRGARGGQHFFNSLGLQEPVYPDEPVMLDDPLKQLPIFGSYPNEQWDNLISRRPDNSKDILLEEVGPLFATAFMGSSAFTRNVNTAFTTLQKIVAAEIKYHSFVVQECPFIQCIVIYLGLILKGPKCSHFESGFLKHVRYSCPLMRLLLNCRQSPFDDPLTKVAETLLQHYGNATGPLISVLKMFIEGSGVKKVSKFRQSEMAKSVVQKMDEVNSQCDQVNKKDFLVRTLEMCPINMLEHIGRCLIETQDSKVLIDAMVTILERQQSGTNEFKIKLEPNAEMQSSQLCLANGGEASGLIIDWLADLQPELLGDDPKAQIRLMFRAGGAPWQELLVALLAHRASWRTLHCCLTALLASEKEWAATSVLELIWALTRSPRIWQGRDKTTPKHHTPENILRLTSEQLSVLISYILEEAEQCKNQDQACLKIESRLPLLLECLQDDQAIVSALVSLQNKSIESSPTVQTFIVLLYMRLPKIWNILSTKGNSPISSIMMHDSSETDYTESSTSIIDKISHCMFTALAANPHSKDWKNRIQPGLEASCKSMCRQHPRLALRQLGLLGTLLKGRSHLAWGPFQNGGHFTYFSHTLRILEMLQPSLFALPYRSRLHTTLDSYFAVIAMHGHVKDLAPLIHKFSVLLQGYMAYDTAAANDYIRDHHNIISSQPVLSILNIAGALPAQQPETPQIGKSDWGSDRQAQSVQIPFSDPSPLTVLKNVIASTVDSNTGLAALMRCLDASNPEIAIAALEKLPELVVCMQEHASQILAKVFELGMRSKINTESYITKCVTTLNAYRGC